MTAPSEHADNMPGKTKFQTARPSSVRLGHPARTLKVRHATLMAQMESNGPKTHRRPMDATTGEQLVLQRWPSVGKPRHLRPRRETEMIKEIEASTERGRELAPSLLHHSAGSSSCWPPTAASEKNLGERFDLGCALWQTAVRPSLNPRSLGA